MLAFMGLQKIIPEPSAPPDPEINPNPMGLPYPEINLCPSGLPYLEINPSPVELPYCDGNPRAADPLGTEFPYHKQAVDSLLAQNCDIVIQSW